NDSKSKAKMPMLLVQIDPNFVSLNLYENNQLTLSRFASIDPEDYENSEDYIYEAVNENILRMFQFQKSRSGDSPIQNVVFYGDTTEYIRLTNSLEQMDISTSLLGVPGNIGGYENFEFQSYANAIGAMFRGNKDTERINLIEVDAASGRTSAGAKFALAVFGSIAISAAVVGAVWVFEDIQQNGFVSDTAVIQEYLDSPEVAAQIAAVDTAQTKFNKVNNVKAYIDVAYDNYGSLPMITSDVIRDIEANFSGTSVDWTTISYGNGYFTVQCTANRVNEPSEVIGKFFEQDIFENVTYNGFSQSGEEGAGASGYEFSVSFSMRPVEPEPAEEEAEQATAEN
ncbi:MAG: hypothetical protein K2J73_03035, partial [Oscillospiraceae bacterium]|nr:hypothetical protein [Oscillospiraceae bacterium]